MPAYKEKVCDLEAQTVSHDKCLAGLSHGRFKRKRGRECSDDGEGKAWTVVDPKTLKEWNGEPK
jgi:hypothetical protein